VNTSVWTYEKSARVKEPIEPSGVLRKVGGIPITSAAVPGTAAVQWAVCRGAVMARILNDVLLFACATLFVTGIVLAAAKLLI
jgi:hypothetical protein